jgi:hypothetical protein
MPHFTVVACTRTDYSRVYISHSFLNLHAFLLQCILITSADLLRQFESLFNDQSQNSLSVIHSIRRQSILTNIDCV